MSMNAAFGSIFKPNSLYRNLSARLDDDALHHDDHNHNEPLSSISDDELEDLDEPVLRDVDDDVGLLTDQVRALTAEKAALAARLEELEAHAQQLEDEKIALEDHQYDYGDRARELEARVAQLANDKERLEADAATLQREISRLTNQAAEARVAADEAQANAQAARTEADAVRVQLEAAQAEAEAARVEAESAQAKVEVARTEAEAARAEAAAAAEREKLAQEKPAEVDGEVVALINELTTERDRLLAHNEALEREKDALQLRHDELQAQPRVDDELATLVSGMATKNEQLQKQNEELEVEIDEVYDLMEQMNEHVESLELHQQSLIAYVNKVCNDMKNTKRRGVWQKIEYDKERQLLVEELYQWKRQAEVLKANEKDAIAAAEAKAAWDAACLNQTIEQLQGEALAIKTELDVAKEELSRRGASAEVTAETEQMLEALQELALDLKNQVDESNAALEAQKMAAVEELTALQTTMQELKQRSIKDAVTFDKERQELMEEMLMWKNRALEATAAEPESATSSASGHKHGDESTTVEQPEVSDDGDNQTEHDAPAKPDSTKTVEEPPASTSSESSSVTEETEPAEKLESKTNGGEPASNQEEAPIKVPITELLEQEDEDDKDVVSESTLHSPKRGDSFFEGLMRSFSFRSRSDSVSSSQQGQEPEATPVSRSRADSVASTTSSVSSTTKRVKKTPPPPSPVTQYTRNDFLRQQEPLRMNSFKHFL